MAHARAAQAPFSLPTCNPCCHPPGHPEAPSGASGPGQQQSDLVNNAGRRARAFWHSINVCEGLWSARPGWVAAAPQLAPGGPRCKGCRCRGLALLPHDHGASAGGSEGCAGGLGSIACAVHVPVPECACM